MSQKTAAIIALLNIIHLPFVHADDLYQALRKKNKYDPQTVEETRLKTVEQEQIKKANALTKSNPNFIPLSKLPPKKNLTPEEWTKKRDQEKNEPDDEFDKEEKSDKKLADAPKSEPSEPKSKGAKAPRTEVGDSPAVKVTTDDPDEVTFSDAEEKPAKAGKPSPTSGTSPKKK